MKIFKTLNVRKPFTGVKRFITKDVLFTVFLSLFLAGYLTGCILQMNGFESMGKISGFIGRYIYLSLPTFGFFKIMIKMLKIIGAMLFSVFCLGLFVPGQVMLTLVCLLQGIFLGSAVTFMFGEYGFSGLGSFAVLILPSLLIFLNFQFIMIKRAFELSFSIFRTVFYGSTFGIYKKYKSFMVYFAVMLLVAFLCSLAVALSYRFLGRIFV